MNTPPFNVGPWVTGDGNAEVIYAGKGTNRFEIATVAGPTSIVPQRETSANAKLIAEAPAMFAAIERLLNEGRGYSDETWYALKRVWQDAGGIGKPDKTLATPVDRSREDCA